MRVCLKKSSHKLFSKSARNLDTMRLLFWVTALAVLSITWAKNSTTKAKPKRQLDDIRSPKNLQYSLILPHSRVAHFRSLGDNNRRISNAPQGGKLPPYAVQMEPVVQYSQKDPLYDRNHDNNDNKIDNKKEVHAQSKILNVDDSSLESNYGPPYGSLQTAPLYSNENPPQYYEAPEPIIEIIIKESNESIPAPPPPPPQKKKKEPVHVFYVKYSKDPHSKDKVIYEKPIPAVTPPTNDEDENEHDQYVTVTPEPIYLPPKTTTLRAIIKPESEIYHSDSSVKVTFGNEGRQYGGRHEHLHLSEDHEETAPRPAIAYPNQPPQYNIPVERSASPNAQLYQPVTSPTVYNPTVKSYKPSPIQQAQSRIQYQQPQSQYLSNEQQLPRQDTPLNSFRAQPVAQSHAPRHPFGPPVTFNGAFSNGPIPVNPTAGSPVGPVLPTAFPRANNGPAPAFHPRPAVQASFPIRSHFNSPPKLSFHSGPQNPFHPSQTKTFFDDPKYLQENYHTITTEQVEPPKEQLLPNKQQQTFNPHLQAGPSAAPIQFQDHRPVSPFTQQLPQQRPPQRFSDLNNKQPLTAGPSSAPFFNLKPAPPHIDNNRPPFHQPQLQQQQQKFSFHQGPQPSGRPPAQLPADQNIHNTFLNPIPALPSPLPPNQFLPQPTSPTLYNFQQPSPIPNHFQQISPSDRPQYQPQGPSERPQFQSLGPSERPQFQPIGPSERPQFQPIGPSERSKFQHQSPSERPYTQPLQDIQHQQNVGQFVQNGGELVPAISKYEQHYTINGPTAQPGFNGHNELGHPSPSPSPSPSPQSPHADQFQQQYDAEQEQLRLQLAANVQKQQEEIQRLQAQILYTQQQHQQHQHDQIRQQQEAKKRDENEKQRKQHQKHQQDQLRQQQEAKQQEQRYKQQQQHEQQQNEQLRQQQEAQLQEQRYQQQQQNEYIQQKNNYNQQQSHYKQQVNNYNQQTQSTSPRSQYIQERSRPHSTSTVAPNYYQSTPRNVEIKASTPKYSSTTANSINSASESKKEEKKNKPSIELPDEVPDDLRQQLLSSGILDNADISVLDYDKVGDTPLDSLPPDQLANFFSAGGAQQIAASEHKPIIVTPDGERIQSRLDDSIDDDQDEAASENIATYVAPPTQNQAVEMKVVHFDPKTSEGQNIANEYVQENATQIDTVSLNDKKYNRYLPLKVSGNQFPLPDILKGKKITSVVVLAPVETEALTEEHKRTKRATSNSLKGIKFVAGDSLQDLLKKPTKNNFEKWLDVEKSTASDMQSIVLLVTGNESPTDEREIFMYDISSGNVNKLSGELSSAFVEAAENNSLSKDIESLAIEGEGTPELFDKEPKDDVVAEGSENVPLLVDLSGLSLDQDPNSQVSISSGYSKTKHGRSLRRH